MTCGMVSPMMTENAHILFGESEDQLDLLRLRQKGICGRTLRKRMRIGRKRRPPSPNVQNNGASPRYTIPCPTTLR